MGRMTSRWLSPAVFVLGSLLGTATPALAQCAEPVAPAGINGAAATAEQMKYALDNVSNYIAQSDSYQTCLVNAIEAAKAQAAANQQPFDSSIEQTTEGLIEANQRLKEAVGNAVNAALSDFKNSHGVAQGQPPNNGVAGASGGMIRDAGQYNLAVESDIANCIEFFQPSGRYAEGVAISLHNTCGKWILWIMGPIPFKSPMSDNPNEMGYVCAACGQMQDIAPNGYSEIADDFFVGYDKNLVCNIPAGDDPNTTDRQTAWAQSRIEWDRCIDLYNRAIGSQP
jgi:hypothetical protein